MAKRKLKFLGPSLKAVKPALSMQGNREKRRTALRGTKAERGYDEDWRRDSKAFLRRHSYCEYCKIDGLQTTATLVDHLYPHGLRRGRQDELRATLFATRGYWVASCVHCHNSMKYKVERNGIHAIDALAQKIGRPALEAPTFRDLVVENLNSRNV